MGHHYIPRKYLKGFANPAQPDTIWMYDKKLRRFTNPSIASAAQEAEFYSAEDEKQLSELVEKPANRVLDKLRSRERINEDDRIHLGIYIATMLKRVPKRRTQALSLLPGIYEETTREIRRAVDEWAQSVKDQELVRRRYEELENSEQMLHKKTPPDILEEIRRPWASERIISAVCAMHWRIAFTAEPDYFLTSDNPAFFFEAYGIGRPESEVTFPIAADIALFGSWQGKENSTSYLKAKPALVREANRRLISGSERFVFSHRSEAWITTLAEKPKSRLNRIRW